MTVLAILWSLVLALGFGVAFIALCELGERREDQGRVGWPLVERRRNKVWLPRLLERRRT